MDNLVMQGYKSGLKIVPTIPRYDNSGTEITDANYWPVPIDSVFRTNYGFNVYTGNGKRVTTTDTTKRFIITDYGGFTPKNPQESYSAQELYNLVLDARGLTHGKNYALSILDSTTGKSGRVILTASDNTARLTYALTLQLEDADGNLLSNKAVAVNKCAWHVLPDGTNTGTFSLEPDIVVPGMTILDPGNLPAQIYLRYSLYVAPFMGHIFGGASSHSLDHSSCCMASSGVAYPDTFPYDSPMPNSASSYPNSFISQTRISHILLEPCRQRSFSIWCQKIISPHVAPVPRQPDTHEEPLAAQLVGHRAGPHGNTLTIPRRRFPGLQRSQRADTQHIAERLTPRKVGHCLQDAIFSQCQHQSPPVDPKPRVSL